MKGFTCHTCGAALKVSRRMSPVEMKAFNQLSKSFGAKTENAVYACPKCYPDKFK